MRHTNKNLLVLIIIILLAATSIIPAFGQDQELVIWADTERASLLTELGQEFEANFGVKVVVREIGMAEARNELLNFGEAGEGPDILIQPHDNVGQLVDNGAVLPIELGDLTDLFNPTAVDLFSYQGELWALPYQTENIALIRNVDLIPEVPATWQEVSEISAELRESGAAEYAFLIQTGDTYHHHPILSAFGGYIFERTEEGYNPANVGFDSEGGLAAAAWLGEQYAEGYMVPNVGDDEIFALFEAGELGMFVTGPWSTQRIIDAAELGGFEYAISSFPGAEGAEEAGVPFVGGQGFMISAFTTQPLVAQQFLLEFVATQDIMQQLSSRFPVFAGVTADDATMAFGVAAEGAVPMPNIPEMAAVWAGAGDALTLVSQGQDPVESFLNGALQIREAIVVSQSGERIIGIPGNFQALVGCAGDWDPACDVTFFEDQGDGIFTLTVTLPAGDYEYKIATSGSWAENYGQGGVADGPNITLSLEEETEVTFTFDDNTKILSDSVLGER